MSFLVKLLPRLVKSLGPVLVKNLPKVSRGIGALLAGAGLVGLVGGAIGSHGDIKHDQNEFPPLKDFPPIPESPHPRPPRNPEPWVKGPKKEKRPPRLPPGGHYEPAAGGGPLVPIQPGPNVPSVPYPGPGAPPNSPRGSDGSGDPGFDPFGGDGDPWGEDDDGDREPEPGHPRPRKQWPPDWPVTEPFEDELYEKWRAWIRLFRVWRHDVNTTYLYLKANAPADSKPFIDTLMPIVEQIIKKPMKPYPITELAADIHTTWYKKLTNVYVVIRDEEWAKSVKQDYINELDAMAGLNDGLVEIGLYIAETSKHYWVSRDYPGDPADVTQSKKALEFYDRLIRG